MAATPRTTGRTARPAPGPAEGGSSGPFRAGRPGGVPPGPRGRGSGPTPARTQGSRRQHQPPSRPRRDAERTFGWLTRWRRLSRDYEQRIDVSEAMIHVAMGTSPVEELPADAVLKQTPRPFRLGLRSNVGLGGCGPPQRPPGVRRLHGAGYPAWRFRPDPPARSRTNHLSFRTDGAPAGRRRPRGPRRPFPAPAPGTRRGAAIRGRAASMPVSSSPRHASSRPASAKACSTNSRTLRASRMPSSASPGCRGVRIIGRRQGVEISGRRARPFATRAASSTRKASLARPPLATLLGQAHDNVRCFGIRCGADVVTGRIGARSAVTKPPGLAPIAGGDKIATVPSERKPRIAEHAAVKEMSP